MSGEPTAFRGSASRDCGVFDHYNSSISFVPMIRYVMVVVGAGTVSIRSGRVSWNAGTNEADPGRPPAHPVTGL